MTEQECRLLRMRLGPNDYLSGSELLRQYAEHCDKSDENLSVSNDQQGADNIVSNQIKTPWWFWVAVLILVLAIGYYLIK
jgi:hypothetical protein